MKTSLYSILCIVVRLGAVWLAASILVAMPALLSTSTAWGMTGTLAERWWMLGNVVVSLLVALGLWIYPGVLARLAAGRASQQVFESPIEPDDIQRIAISVLGMYFTVAGLILLWRSVVYGLIVGRASTEGTFWGEQMTAMIGDLTQIVIGIALAFGSRGLVGMLRRYRHAGLAAAVVHDEPVNHEVRHVDEIR